mgnify:FL=1
MQLTKNFSLEEMCYSDMAAARKIANKPGKTEEAALRLLCERVLQPLRDKHGKSIGINSGYRCVTLNRVLGGSGTSQHVKGEAADLRGDIKELFRIIVEEKLPFDQLIWENTWVHVSHSRTRNRGQILWYHSAKNGKKSWYEDISKRWREVIGV